MFRFASAILVTGAIGVVTLAAKPLPQKQIKLVRVGSETRVPGELQALIVDGLNASIPEDSLKADIEVSVVRDGIARKARVDSVAQTHMAPALARGEKLKIEEAVALVQVRLFHQVTFALPRGVKEGQATVVLSYRGAAVGSAVMTVALQPGAPGIAADSFVGAPGSATRVSGLKFQPAQAAEIFMSPLVDPEDSSAGIAVTF